MSVELEDTTSLGITTPEALGFNSEEELLQALVPLMLEADKEN